MAYNASYTDGDISTAAVDGVVKIIIAFASLATLIGMIFVYKFVKARVGK
jgi:hypothetical protein